MKLALGRRRYPLNTSLICLLRYRASFGVSFFSDFFRGDSVNSLLRLAWSAIEGEKPDFARFVRLSLKTRGFADAALEVQAAVLRTAGSRRAGGEATAEEFDELDVLAMMAVSGISMDLVHVLPAFLILDVVSKRTAIMSGNSENGGTKFHRMSGEEMRRLYGG